MAKCCTIAPLMRLVLNRSLVAGVLAYSAVMCSAAAPASAETLSISATGLVWRGPDSFSNNTDSAEESNGVFVGQKPNGRYFAPVVFPVTTGRRICSFTMVYQDLNQSDTMTARLLRKSYTVGGQVFTAPTTIATARSAAGVSNAVRVATANANGFPLVNVTQAFYYIEVDIPTFNLNVLGFQVVYKPTCP